MTRTEAISSLTESITGLKANALVHREAAARDLQRVFRASYPKYYIALAEELEEDAAFLQEILAFIEEAVPA